MAEIDINSKLYQNENVLNSIKYRTIATNTDLEYLCNNCVKNKLYSDSILNINSFGGFNNPIYLPIHNIDSRINNDRLYSNGFTPSEKYCSQQQNINDARNRAHSFNNNCPIINNVASNIGSVAGFIPANLTSYYPMFVPLPYIYMSPIIAGVQQNNLNQTEVTKEYLTKQANISNDSTNNLSGVFNKDDSINNDECTEADNNSFTKNNSSSYHILKNNKNEYNFENNLNVNEPMNKNSTNNFNKRPITELQVNDEDSISGGSNQSEEYIDLDGLGDDEKCSFEQYANGEQVMKQKTVVKDEKMYQRNNISFNPSTSSPPPGIQNEQAALYMLSLLTRHRNPLDPTTSEGGDSPNLSVLFNQMTSSMRQIPSTNVKKSQEHINNNNNNNNNGGVPRISTQPVLTATHQSGASKNHRVNNAHVHRIPTPNQIETVHSKTSRQQLRKKSDEQFD